MRDKVVSKKANLFAASRFVLPEHREMYMRIQEEQKRYIPPELGCEERAELSGRIWEAYQQKQLVDITYFVPNSGERREMGHITHIDQAQSSLKLAGAKGTVRISFDVVLGVGKRFA